MTSFQIMIHLVYFDKNSNDNFNLILYFIIFWIYNKNNNFECEYFVIIII